MASTFLLYGATGYVGAEMARLAVANDLQPVLAGRDAARLEKIASDLGVERRVFDLNDPDKIEQALKDVAVVLHCAGPFIYTFKPMVEACLKTGTHYLDITGEIPVYEAIAARDAEARQRGVMLLPGVGLDVVPTDCLALHLKQRLPSATHLSLAFKAEGPGGLPPGTQRTLIEMVPYGERVRHNGRIVITEQSGKTRLVDFGRGPVLVTRLTWGDIFTAYHSTGIPNIEDYFAFSKALRQQMSMFNALRPLFKLPVIRSLVKLGVKPGPTAEQRSRTVTHVWGEVEDDQGNRAAARLHGPEAGVDWTAQTALRAVHRVLEGDAPAGYQTPATAYGPDFVLEGGGVTREDLV